VGGSMFWFYNIEGPVCLQVFWRQNLKTHDSFLVEKSTVPGTGQVVFSTEKIVIQLFPHCHRI
jgi:hypothetical protein